MTADATGRLWSPPVTVEQEQQWGRQWIAYEDRLCRNCGDEGCAFCDSDDAA